MSPSLHFALLGRNITYSKSPDIFAAIGQMSEVSIAFEVLSIFLHQTVKVPG